LVETYHLIPPIAFGSVQALVGLIEQVLGVHRPELAIGKPDTAGHVQPPDFAPLKGPVECIGVTGSALQVDFVEQDREFLAAKSANDPFVANKVQQ
jgi:hypothetical protein